jgi:hypothetical protein
MNKSISVDMEPGKNKENGANIKNSLDFDSKRITRLMTKNGLLLFCRGFSTFLNVTIDISILTQRIGNSPENVADTRTYELFEI